MAPQLAAAAMLAVGFGVQALFSAGGVLAYSAADPAASPLAPLPALLAKAALCLGAYAAPLAATGQWRHLRLIF